MVLVVGVEGGGGGGEEERAECVCMCESAGRFSVVSPLPARCSPSVSSRCVRGREGAGESLLSLPLSPPLSPLSLSLSPLSLFSLLSPSPPPSLSLFVCVPVCGCWGRGAGKKGEGGGGRLGAEAGAGVVGAEVRRTQGRGHLLMIGCKLHGEQEAHAGRRSPSQILSSPEEPRFPARLLLALPPRAWLSGSAAQHRGLLIIFFYSRR